ncbi:MAG: YitT family protein [Bacilli bacterium]|nr:YitT family protein [Bacilli bacterium]
MKRINERLYRIFKWNVSEIIQTFIGLVLFCIGINFFVEPNHLYSGGILGLSQLLNRLINDLSGSDIYLTGLIYLCINIPLLMTAYFAISKSFCARTIFAVGVQTILLDIIPIPSAPLVPDLLTNVLIAGTLVGIGIAHILSATGSTGGTDIIGIILTSKYPGFSVGRFALGFNAVVFGISGLLYGVATMIYSIMYSIIENISIDKLHEQNISSCATIFTKEKPNELIQFIKKDLDRGATCWEGKGIYDDSKTYITYIALSRYELHKLEKFLSVSKQEVFLVKNDYVGVDGEFRKKLSK